MMARLTETVLLSLWITIAVLGILILLAIFGFSLYLLITVLGPWIITALMAAAISHGLALFIVILPALIFAAPLFAFLCLHLSNTLKFIIHSQETAPNHRRRYLHLRGEDDDGYNNLDDYYSVIFAINFILALLVGIGIGVYLSVLIVPTFISALAATGAPYLLALSAGVVTGGIFITLAILFLMTPVWIYWRIIALPGVKDLRENPLQILPLLAMFGGLAFGGYLVSLVAPLLIATLAPIGIPHATVIFAVIIICSELVLTTSFFSFTTATGISYLFNHVNFKPLVDRCGAFMTRLGKLTEALKPLLELVDPNPIKQAIAEYHQNKPFWRKLLSFFSHNLGTDRDIEKIERFLQEKPNWRENLEALKSLLKERAAHTYGSYYFYTQSPNNAVNKAYITIAKIIAGQDINMPLSVIAYINLINKEQVKVLNDNIMIQSISSGSLSSETNISSPEAKRLFTIAKDNHGRSIENNPQIFLLITQTFLKTFIAPLLATFYNKESDIAFKEVHEYAETHGLFKGNVLHDLSLFKLLNPLRWVEFLLRLAASITNALISIGIWPDSKILALLNKITSYNTSIGSRLGIENELLNFIVSFSGIFIVGLFRYCISLPIKIICKTLIAILSIVANTAIFLLRSLSVPIDTVLTPWLKLYREQPIKFFALFLVSTTLVAFLMTGFGLGTALPGIMWLSNNLFALASLASTGSPALMVIISTLLIGLLLYEAMAILDALIIPFTIMALSTLKNGLYYLSEIRFQRDVWDSNTSSYSPRLYAKIRNSRDNGEEDESQPPLSTDDILVKFDGRYPVSLEMPSLSSQPYVRLVP